MLPTILSDALCSLQENQPRFAFVLDITVDPTGNIIHVENSYALIRVFKNYRYEEKALTEQKEYLTLLSLSQKMDRTNKNSHDIVTYWMVLVNKHCGRMLADKKKGIFRSSYFIHPIVAAVEEGLENVSEDTCRVIRSWNNTVGQYVSYTEEDTRLDHEMMSIKSFKLNETSKKTQCYIHITSPIRRIVDLLNQMILFSSTKSMSPSAMHFLNSWLSKIEYINRAMRSIRKIQIDCDILARCYSSPEMLNDSHKGVLFDRIVRNDGMISYMVYLEKLKILSRITVSATLQLEVYTVYSFKLFLFEDESKVKRKIRLQIV